MERQGKFPKRRQISANAIGWLASELTDWMAARTAAAVATDTDENCYCGQAAA